MEAMTTKETSRWWWFDSHNSPRRSPWLQSTLSEFQKAVEEVEVGDLVMDMYVTLALPLAFAF